MKNYLSYGGGVNSTAMLLLLLDEGWDFEAVYVDHGCDWPETRKYVAWLSKQTPITILKPMVQNKWNDLYSFFWDHFQTPSIQHRSCTDKFKVRPIHKYCQTPSFQLIGIDAGESHRAKIMNNKGMESRYPLIEYEIDRQGCIDIIKAHGLPVPMKSGCYICPFQRVAQWRKLRREHPDLFCKVKKLEARYNEHRAERGGSPDYFLVGRPLDDIVDETAGELFEEYANPPCRCEL